MNLALTSDFPSTATQDVVAAIRATGMNPRVAWIPPTTASGRRRFAEARAVFQSLGVQQLEYCDIDEEFNERQLAHLDEYEVVYLTGGDPILFRQNIGQRDLAERLRAFAGAGGLVVAASGGAMQLTPNVSLYRLTSHSVEDVIRNHAAYEGLRIVGYEILPHLNRLDSSFLDKVTSYSELVPHDIIALDDGGVIVHAGSNDWRCVGRAVRFRQGTKSFLLPHETS